MGRRAANFQAKAPPERAWRTRADPFEEAWREVGAILERAPTVEAKAVFDQLCRQTPGRFEEGQPRTLQSHLGHHLGGHTGRLERRGRHF